MSTIDDQKSGRNPSTDASGEKLEPRSTEESTHIEEDFEPLDGRGEVTATMEPVGEIIDKPPPESTKEGAPASVTGGLNALAWLRTNLEAHGKASGLEGAFSKLEQAIRRPRAERTEGGDDNAPESVTRRAEGDDDDDQPSTSRMLAAPLSRLAVRHDGALLVTLEDADDRDLSGREILRCMILSEKEAARARTTGDEALSDAAASIIGRLPKRAI